MHGGKLIRSLRAAKIDANCVDNAIEKTKNWMNEIKINTNGFCQELKFASSKEWLNVHRGQLPKSSLIIRRHKFLLFLHRLMV